MPWEDLLKKLAKKAAEAKEAEEKLKKKESENKDLTAKTQNSVDQKSTTEEHQPKELKRYYLGDNFGNIYFTEREGQCMNLVLQGKTIDSIGLKMRLSPRTIEFYVKNMKTKLGCRTKFELIDLVHLSDFVRNFKNLN